MAEEEQTDQRRGRDAKHLEAFFAQYKKFKFDPSKPAILEEFRRLREVYGWKEGSKKERYVHRQLKKALIEQFNSFYGRGMGDIRAWKDLCWAVGVHPVPETVWQCKAIIQITHVNLIDLVDAQRVGSQAKTFNSVDELQDYTRQTDRFFPRNVASSDKLLRFLLRPISKLVRCEEEGNEKDSKEKKGRKRRRRRNKKKKAQAENVQAVAVIVPSLT